MYFKADEVVLDESFNPEDDDDSHHDADGSGDHQMEDATNGSAPKAADSHDQHSGKSAQGMNPQQQAVLIDETLDKACEQLVNEISFKVMVEFDGDVRPFSPTTAEDYATYCALVESSNVDASYASEVPVPVLDSFVSPCAAVREASITVPLAVAVQEMLPRWFMRDARVRRGSTAPLLHRGRWPPCLRPTVSRGRSARLSRLPPCSLLQCSLVVSRTSFLMLRLGWGTTAFLFLRSILGWMQWL